MGQESRRYLSYLLRLWQTHSEGEHIWRASLENPGTGQRRGFPCLHDLFVFLEGQTRSGSPAERTGDAAGSAQSPEEQ